MSNLGPWGTEDFDAMSWHDVNVHGFHLENFNEKEGDADLLFDIDYILHWQKSGNGFLFTVCRAELRFHKTFGLKFELNYAAPSAGMCPFSVAGIEREVLQFANGHKTYCWRMPINWPQGLVEFQAPSFTQTLIGEPHVQSQQFLSPSKRHG